MSIRTESYEVVKNDDGSYTTTEISTYIPPTPKQQALAVAGLFGFALLPVGMMGAIVAFDKFQEKREARRKAKLELKK